jgi:threonine dehydrogenase-like Zn-dependent dehydrogenase
MKIAVLNRHGFEVCDRDIPTYGPGEILIKTLACGICSGDLFIYQNRVDLAASHSLLGHEATGVVVGIGRDVTGLAEGHVVTALGMPAYADHLTTPPDQVVKLPPKIDPVTALGEPVACCVHAANRFGTVPGDRVAVVGCGFMGLICLQLARYQGAGFICALDPVADRRDMSRLFGAQVALDPTTTSMEEIVAQHGEFDLVIEAAGSQSALDLCGDLVKEHGRLILVGYHQSDGGLRTVLMQQWNLKAIDVVNGHVRRQDEKVEAMRQGIDLMRQGHVVTAPLVTTYALAEIETAFRDLTTGLAGLFKAVLLPDPDLRFLAGSIDAGFHGVASSSPGRQSTQ